MRLQRYLSVLIIMLLAPFAAACRGPAKPVATSPTTLPPVPLITVAPRPAESPRPGVVLIRVGLSPCASVPAPDGMWLSNYSDDSISRIDPTTNQVAATFPVGAHPCGIVYAAGKMWVGLVGDQALVSFDGATGRKLDEIKTDGPVYDVQTRDNAVWYDDWVAGDVMRADARDGRPTAKIHVGGSIYGLAITPEGIWAADTQNKVVIRIDPVTAKETARIPTGGVPFTFAYTPGAVWVTTNPGAIVRIDPATNKVVKTIKFGHMPKAAGDPDALGGYVYVPDADSGQVAKIDPKTNTYVVLNASLGHGFSVAQAGFGSMWNCDYAGQTIARLDPASAFKR